MGHLSIRIALAVSAVTLAAVVTGERSRAAQPPAADLVLVNGTVLTVDANDRVAEAVAIAGGRIVAVGSTTEIRTRAGASTEVIDLAGRAVTPGLLDAHAHFSGGGAQRLFVVDLSYPAVKNMEDVGRAIREQAAKLSPNAWIEGRGWDEGKLTERRVITARDIDRAAGEHPVYLTNTTGHYGVANSVALKLAGITKDTPDPPSGTIDRHPDGTPTGVLKESAQNLVRKLVPDRTPDEMARGIRELAAAFNAEGMTGAKDPGISASTWEAYRRVRAENALTVRVFALWSGGSTLAAADSLVASRAAMTRPYEKRDDDTLIAGGVKLFMDGSGGARTAWLYDDWNKERTAVDTGNRGYPAADPDTIRAMIRRYHQAGMHVSVHAIGDRAIDWIVDSYAEALAATPTKGLRHGIIHANIPTDRAIDTMARLQRDYDAGYPEASAGFMWWIGDNYAANLGPQRNVRLKPFQTFVKKGVQWGGGSDYSVTPFPVRYGIWASVARETLNGTHGARPFGTAEAVDVRTALRSYTAWAAARIFLDDRLGTIEAGKDADLAVWDRSPYEVSTAALKDLRCEMTFVRGRLVYRR